MKTVSKKPILGLSLPMLASLAMAASPYERIYLDSCNRDPAFPLPVTVVSPVVGPEFKGGHIYLEFVVDETGTPSRFTVKTTTDDALVRPVVAAVRQWRFLPATADGIPVAQKVVLPVRIVDPIMQSSRLAANEG